MVPSSDVLVVGGGILGVCTAYHLARGGARVTLIEAKDPGAGASGGSFAWINATSKEPRSYHDLNHGGIEAYERLFAAVAGESPGTPPHTPASRSELLGLHDGGSLHLAVTPDEQAALQARCEELHAWRYPASLLDQASIREREPDLVLPDEDLMAMQATMDCWLDPPRLLGALLAAAQQAGARILSHHPVRSLRRTGDRVTGVVTASGALDAETVLLAAGVRVPELAATADVTVPVERVPGLLALTTPVAGGPRRVFYAPGVHARPTPDGRFLLAASDLDDRVGEETLVEPPPSWAHVLVERLARWYPSLAAARIASARVCVRPMPVDGFPIVGRAPGVDGLYLAATHSGITLGPLLGEAIAHEILGGVSLPLLASYRPDRFLGMQPRS